MKHVNLFQPDTCGCLLIFEWDDSVPETQRVHTPLEEFTNKQGEKFVTQRCPLHQVADVVQLHGKVHEENQRKNKALAEILDSLPDNEKDFDREGNPSFKVKPKWSFDKDRNVVIEMDGDANKKASALARVKAKVSDKVIIK